MATSNTTSGAGRTLAVALKEKVKAWVPQVRAILQADFKASLGRLGLTRDGMRPIPPGLTEEDRALRARIEALFHREVAAEGRDAGRAFDVVLFELTYTLLNRLVGLKCMEARGILYLSPPGTDDPPEQTEVLTPVEGQQYSRYLRDLRATASRYKYEDGAEESLLRDGLTRAFQAITREVRAVFDPAHEYACLWPSFDALRRTIALINVGLPPEAYQARDFLGWLYQFFNRDEKVRLRRATKGKARSSYELAAINQFYTPDWVVKALVDNTLGRLWGQMHPGSRVLSKTPPPRPGERAPGPAVADYLVPNTAESLAYQRGLADGTVERFKKVRDIRLLDPACGTMHFGQYAYGLFVEMYLEELENAGREGWPAEPSVRSPAEIPTAIVEHNLYGIDIDARAIQIASVSLLLTAKETGKARFGLLPSDVRLTRSHLVVANAGDVGEDALRALLDRIGGELGDRALREKLFRAVWESLRNVSELGSLVRVHESVRAVLDEWVEAMADGRGIRRGLLSATAQGPQLELGGIVQDAEQRKRVQQELKRKLYRDEADKILQSLLATVQEAAREGGDVGPAQRLYAEDTARGVQLIELLGLRYDVVVMNPPYGDFVVGKEVKAIVERHYPIGKNDIYAAFIVRATELVEREGYVGALVSSSFAKLSSFESLRTEVLLKRNPLVLMLDLGSGVLDEAMVEAAAVVLRGSIP